MAQPRRGRPPNPVDADASHGARLGAKLRVMRTDAGLTLAQLGDLADGYTPQYISEVERAKTAATPAFVAAVDRALNAHGALEELLPAAMREHEEQRRKRAAARRAQGGPALRCDVHSDAGEDVEPTNRRGLLGASAAAAIGLSTTATPAVARDVDPELPDHYSALLALFGKHDDAFGPHAVLGVACKELGRMDEHCALARGKLRRDLMRVQARWATHAGWLCEDAGDRRGRDALLERALHLARESDSPDVEAWASARQSQFSIAPATAVGLAERALRTPRASPQARVLCATRAAHAHARAGDRDAAERMIAEAETLAARKGPPAPLSRNLPHDSAHDVRCWEARCWGTLAPAKAIPMYESLLRDWPPGETRDGGLYMARLAVVCAAAGELDRAEAEGRKALAIARATNSASAFRELKQLGAVLSAN
jgi:transcriptional regulator with XRE-family HTH domain